MWEVTWRRGVKGIDGTMVANQLTWKRLAWVGPMQSQGSLRVDEGGSSDAHEVNSIHRQCLALRMQGGAASSQKWQSSECGSPILGFSPVRPMSDARLTEMPNVNSLLY